MTVQFGAQQCQCECGWKGDTDEVEGGSRRLCPKCGSEVEIIWEDEAEA